MNQASVREQYICYVAGKSGGHIIPALTHGEQARTCNPDLKVLFFLLIALSIVHY